MKFLRVKGLFILLAFAFFSFDVYESKLSNNYSNELIDSLFDHSVYVLKAQVVKKDNDGQWSKGYTDYHVECIVTKDYKNNFTRKKVYFHHRVKGESKEEILQGQLEVGEEYIAFLDSSHTIITKGVLKNGSFQLIEEKVYVLTDNYNGVIPYDLEIEKYLRKE